MNARSNNLAMLALAVALAACLAACKPDTSAPEAAAPADTAAAAPDATASTPAPADGTADGAAATPDAGAAAVTIAKIDLGTSVGADNTIAAPVNAFKAGDAVVAAVSTEGSAAAAALEAKWMAEDGTVLDQSAQDLKDVAGPAVTDFSLAKTVKLKAGKYKLAVSVDGKPATTTEFTVAQ